MKKGFAVFAVLLLLSLSQVTQAVTLEEGWYVKLGGVALFGFDPVLSFYTGADWHFTVDTGDQGPFNVASPDPVWAERMVSVPETVTGVIPGASVYLWGEPTYPVTYAITEVGFFWETNYDASRMRLDLLAYDGAGFTLLWSQDNSGLDSGFRNVLTASQSIPVGSVPVFRVTVVPEPSSMLAMIGCVAGAVFVLRRRI